MVFCTSSFSLLLLSNFGVETSLDLIISYNLIVSNPFHDNIIEGLAIEEIVEGDNAEKTKFLRKTSKYFS